MKKISINSTIRRYNELHFRDCTSSCAQQIDNCKLSHIRIKYLFHSFPNNGSMRCRLLAIFLRLINACIPKYICATLTDSLISS